MNGLVNDPLKLFVVLLGCKPAGRNVEQHDVFFGIGDSLKSLMPAMRNFWPEGAINLHIDGYMQISQVENYKINIKPAEDKLISSAMKLFFINLGGYVPGDFEELHKKLLIPAYNVAEAMKNSKEHEFYKEGQRLGKDARSHIDDKYLLDLEAEDIIDVSALLNEGNFY
ncbi:MAG: DUF1543 domain-containing protein, partial [Bacteroidota bacterium]|nr:DUF1543 domain-containing protein [Bacteroidota bacterium]